MYTQYLCLRYPNSLSRLRNANALSFLIKCKQSHISSSWVLSLRRRNPRFIQVKPAVPQKVSGREKGPVHFLSVAYETAASSSSAAEPQLFEAGMSWRQPVARQPSTTGVLHFPLLVPFRSSSVSRYSVCMLTVRVIESTSHKNCLCWVGSHGAGGVLRVQCEATLRLNKYAGVFYVTISDY